jgi:translation initiation factor IF-2
MKTARQLVRAVVLALAVPVVMAQAPAGTRDDPDATMRVITDPDARDASQILRAIPPPKPANRTQRPDGSATDLANPRAGGVQDGSPDDAHDPPLPIEPAPIEPGDSGSPSVPGSPDPGGGGLDPREPPASPTSPGAPPPSKPPDSKPPHPKPPDTRPHPPAPHPAPDPAPRPGPDHGPRPGPDHGPRPGPDGDPRPGPGGPGHRPGPDPRPPHRG